ncbi:MAG: hypothetical protein IT582_02180, partial [Opitutaceae bacterium]|nr:hypothetical protein [Opitutaceae bacterium]
TVNLTLPDTSVINTTTDDSGFYQFVGLPAGTYRVSVNTATLPAGWLQTNDLPQPYEITLAAGESFEAADFGYGPFAAVSGLIFEDTNRNGALNSGEPGLPAITVWLYSDGNGNGRIGNNWNACNTGFPEKNESLRFWQHLANAGLIAGSFTGASAGGSVCANGNGVNVPTARLHGKFFWRIISMGPSSAGSNWYRQDINNAFGMGDDLGSFSPYLRPSEAWGIDSKLDDGIPKSGKVQTHTNSSHGNCADATGDGYQLTIDSIACSLEFLDML